MYKIITEVKHRRQRLRGGKIQAIYYDTIHVDTIAINLFVMIHALKLLFI